jgi:hypothetical protein
MESQPLDPSSHYASGVPISAETIKMLRGNGYRPTRVVLEQHLSPLLCDVAVGEVSSMSVAELRVTHEQPEEGFESPRDVRR